MIANDFKKNCHLFENMAIWEISSLEEFMKGDAFLPEIFKKEYGFEFSEEKNPENKFSDNLVTVATKLLDYFGDKHFFVFQNGNPEHAILKELQDKKVINFGMDIHVLHPFKTYVLMMDKTKDMAKYDTV